MKFFADNKISVVGHFTRCADTGQLISLPKIKIVPRTPKWKSQYFQILFNSKFIISGQNFGNPSLHKGELKQLET